MKPVRVLVIALCVATLVLPFATADHTYGHRYLFKGRVIDAAGAPVRDAPIQLLIPPTLQPSPCAENTPLKTNAEGDYNICVHVHGFREGTQVLLRVNDTENRTITLDPRLRKTATLVALPGTAESANASTAAPPATTYAVHGRLWRANDPLEPGSFHTYPDGDNQEAWVTGVPLAGRVVSIELRYNDGRQATARGETNSFGDFFGLLRLEEGLREGTVRVSWENHTAQGEADARFLRSDLDIVIESAVQQPPPQTPTGEGRPPLTIEERPGQKTAPSGSLPVWIGGIVSAALLLGRIRKGHDL